MNIGLGEFPFPEFGVQSAAAGGPQLGCACLQPHLLYVSVALYEYVPRRGTQKQHSAWDIWLETLAHVTENTTIEMSLMLLLF